MAGPNTVRHDRILRQCGVLLALFLVGGCKKADRFYEKVAHSGNPETTVQVPGALAQQGYSAIVEECGHQTFANARKGLIAGVTGMHEDVFELRNPTTLIALAFGLEEGQRLEQMLTQGARTRLHPTDQSGCMQQFAEYLESLTDPLVESVEIQKQLDASAFSESAKHAQEELERAQRMEDASKATQSAEKTP